MQVNILSREFRYNGVKLADPSPSFTLAQVRDFYANTYPEIVNAEIEGPELQGEKHIFSFRRAVGTKGNKGGPLTPEAMRHIVEAGDFVKSKGDRIAPEHINTPVARTLRLLGLRRGAGSAVRLYPLSTSLPLLP
ncbi:PRTRC system protein C [Cupriavidus basilensis]|uniref:PRTRC system protein C n=1 Tax=Cupriavidus basilensis TaxID=68895 RepID=UPI0007C641AB|nr:PRTRC system protein C [Cupriavidus basilensis]